LGEDGKLGDPRLLAINRPDGGWLRAGEKAAKGEAEGPEEAARVYRRAPEQGRRLCYNDRRQVFDERRLLRDHHREVAGRPGSQEV